jgi:hypothetical protein
MSAHSTRPARESEEVTYPAYVPYFPRAWRHNRALGNAAAVLHIATAAGTVVQVIGLLWLRGRVDSFRDGTITSDQLTDATTRYFLIVSIPSLVGAANIVVWIVLLWRMARNHEAIGRPNTTFGVGWAIAGPLVPLANAVVPWLQMNEQWKGSDPDCPPMSAEWKSAPGSPMVNGWWAASLTGTILGLVGTAGVFQAMFSSIDDFGRGGDLVEVAQDIVDNNLQIFVASTLVAGVAGILGAITLRAMVARQDHYAARYSLDQPVAQPAPFIAGAPGPPAGWFPDPSGRFDHRWWDGSRWTETVSRDGTQMTDPLP